MSGKKLPPDIANILAGGCWSVVDLRFAMCERRGMAKLSEFLADSGMTQKALADRVGVSKGYMSDLVAGNRSPGFALASHIVKATGGAVGFEDLLHEKKHGASTPADQGEGL